jgi:hypothetical protein
MREKSMKNWSADPNVYVVWMDPRSDGFDHCMLHICETERDAIEIMMNETPVGWEEYSDEMMEFKIDFDPNFEHTPGQDIRSRAIMKERAIYGDDEGVMFESTSTLWVERTSFSKSPIKRTK